MEYEMVSILSKINCVRSERLLLCFQTRCGSTETIRVRFVCLTHSPGPVPSFGGEKTRLSERHLIKYSAI